MNIQGLLDQLLSSGQQAAQQGQNVAEQKLGIPSEGQERQAMLSGMGKGALAAGAVAMLLGTKTGRSVGGSALKLGSLAALGGLAFKAYQSYAGKQNQPEPTGFQPIGSIEGPAAQARELALLRAMISAAKSDGHIDEAESAAIQEQMNRLGLDESAAQEIKKEIAAPLDAKRIAAQATGPESAAEIYLISRMVIDPDQISEMQYLQQLANELNLDDALVQELEAQVSHA
ncbi:tellurite resistance TerB family protein [Gammaproteobacteria bacterium]|nr:tellurite resistance TerB family protein [Gammaproteobacteria bacterium]